MKKKAYLINGILPAYLRIHWRLSTILKTSKKTHEVMFFWYVKVGILWKCIIYTIHWNKTQMLKKFPLDEINGIKNALFFLSRPSSHHSFTFDFRFLYELKNKLLLSKTVREIFHFRLCFVFIKVFVFVSKMHGVFDFKTSK